MLRILVMVAVAAWTGGAAAQIYECTNARGESLFTEHCPPDTVKQRVVVPGGEERAAGESPPGQKAIEVQEAEFRKRLMERQESEAKAVEDKKRAEAVQRNCDLARAQIKALQEGQRISRVDPDTGERVQFEDADRAEEIARQQKYAEQWCKK